MVLGVLKTCKEVMKNEILRSISLFKRWFFQTKKKFFFENLGSKNDPKMIFRVVGSKIALGGEKVPNI